MKTVVLLTLIGQCYTGNRGYVQQRGYGYVQPTYYNYAQPTYNYPQQVYYAPYVEKIKFVAVENQPSYDYYASLAAAASRSYERFQEYQQVQPQQQAVTYSIPSRQQVIQQPVQQQVVQQQAAPSKDQPQQTYAAPQQQTYAAPAASPQYQVQQQASPQQPTYEAPAPVAKSPPIPSSTPGAPGKSSYDDGSGGVPPPIIQAPRMDYSTAMGGAGEVPPPPPVPAPPAMLRQPQTYNQPQYQQQEPVLNSVNTAFLTNLTRNCASCHTGARSKGSFPIFDHPGRLANLTQDDLQSIYNQVASGKMPYKRSMSPADRQGLMGMLSGNVSSVASR